MGKIAKMHESDSQPVQEKSGWSALPTITTFDRGKTYSQRWRKENAVVSKRLAGFTPSSVFVESLVEQLCKLFEKDPSTQKKLYDLICQQLYQMKLVDKTYKLEEFQFMRSYYQQALYQLLAVSNSRTIDRKVESFLNQSPSCLPLPSAINAGVFDRSRYKDQFEEIEFIARGGFGRVFRVRNKIDGCEYAIKKILIRLRGDGIVIRSLREVRTLAKLDHRNIVAYKAAWFEPWFGVVASGDSSSSSGSKVSLDNEPSDEVLESSFSLRESGDEVEDDSGGIVFVNGNEGTSKGVLGTKSSSDPSKKTGQPLVENHGDNGITSGVAHSHTDCKVKMKATPKHSRSLCDHSSGSSNKGCRGKKVRLGTAAGVAGAVLYIQMQLCKESLKKWLDLRNEMLQQTRGQQAMMGEGIQLHADGIATALNIFLGILDGVEYMHGMGVVHHDLKPSNIFVEGFEYTPPPSEAVGGEPMPFGTASSGGRGRIQVRVGDFGLACHLAHPPASTLVDDCTMQESGGDVAAMAVVPTESAGRRSCLVQTENVALDGDKKAKEVVGTWLYAAPEQLEGRCSLMSDTFSLGIILFELLHPFFTAMERSKIISALRSSGNVPDEFQLTHPILASLIKDMLSPDPSSRPSLTKIIGVVHSILPNYDVEMLKNRNDNIFWDEVQSMNEMTIKRRGRANSFTQTCEQIESYTNIYQSWEELISDGNQMDATYCGNIACRSMRELQDETICGLKQDLLKKDELIEQLKRRILELEVSHLSLDETSNQVNVTNHD